MPLCEVNQEDEDEKALATLFARRSFLLEFADVSIGGDDDLGTEKFRADLDGFQETPATLFSPASGEFEARLVTDNMIEFELSYSGFETVVTTAHIYLGRPAISGGVIAFLCGGGGKPACPQSSGTVTGTITPADVIGPAAQGIAAGEFDKFLATLRAEATYANVQSAARPGGEIRGAIEN